MRQRKPVEYDVGRIVARISVPCADRCGYQMTRIVTSRGMPPQETLDVVKRVLWAGKGVA